MATMIDPRPSSSPRRTRTPTARPPTRTRTGSRQWNVYRPNDEGQYFLTGLSEADAKLAARIHNSGIIPADYSRSEAAEEVEYLMQTTSCDRCNMDTVRADLVDVDSFQVCRECSERR